MGDGRGLLQPPPPPTRMKPYTHNILVAMIIGLKPKTVSPHGQTHANTKSASHEEREECLPLAIPASHAFLPGSGDSHPPLLLFFGGLSRLSRDTFLFLNIFIIGVQYLL